MKRSRAKVPPSVYALLGGGAFTAWAALFVWVLLPGAAVEQPVGAIVGLATALALLGWLLLGRSLVGRRDFREAMLLGGAVWLLPAVGVGVTAPHALNRLLDAVPAAAEQAVVVDVSRGKHSHSTLVIRSGPREGARFTLRGDHSASPAVRVLVHPGAFGWAWVSYAP